MNFNLHSHAYPIFLLTNISNILMHRYNRRNFILKTFVMQNLLDLFLTPIKAVRLRYVPLMMIYFAYGSSVFTAIAGSFLG